MRVIAGSRKRYGLKTPKGDKVRPTTDRIKETLFNMIQDEVEGCFFVDLCAGSGQIGIEALSRGAQRAIFIEQDKAVVSIIKENLLHTKLIEYASVYTASLPAGVKRIKDDGSHFVIFIDPPYDSDLEDDILCEISALDIDDEDMLIVVEATRNKDFSFVYDLGYTIEKEKIYKNNKHVFLRRK